MQTGNVGYHANTEQNTLPKWSHGNDGGGMMNNNSSGARVLEVASPDLHLSNERIRRPSGGPVGQGRPGYPTANNASRMTYDRRRCVCLYVSKYVNACVWCIHMCVYKTALRQRRTHSQYFLSNEVHSIRERA